MLETTNYTFTYIIGYRHKIDRLSLLKRTLDWINGFTGVQVILVEQDKWSKISHLNLKCNHIFVKSNRPYNRSWAFNVGLKYSKSNIVVFGDNDIVMNPNDFVAGLNATKDYEMISPYNSVVDLTQQENGMSLEDIVRITKPGRGETDNQKINISGGISIFRRDAIYKIGGWSEDFWSWGGEDDFQTIKVKNILTWAELNAKCYHFFHNKEQPDASHYNRTLQILQKANQMSKDDLIRSINASLPKIGMKNKCDNFA